MSPMAKVRVGTSAPMVRSRTSASQLPHDRQRFPYMRTGPKLGDEDVADDAPFVDDEGRAPREKAERRLDPEERPDLALGVAEKRHGQLVLLGEAVMRVERIRADADDLGPGLDEGLVAVAKAAGFHRATRGVVLRVEKDDHGLVGVELRERHRVAAR